MWKITKALFPELVDESMKRWLPKVGHRSLLVGSGVHVEDVCELNLHMLRFLVLYNAITAVWCFTFFMIVLLVCWPMACTFISITGHWISGLFFVPMPQNQLSISGLACRYHWHWWHGMAFGLAMEPCINMAFLSSSLLFGRRVEAG